MMNILGYPVPVSWRVCSSTIGPRVQFELKNGVTKMVQGGSLSRLFSYSNLVHAVSGAVVSVNLSLTHLVNLSLMYFSIWFICM